MKEVHNGAYHEAFLKTAVKISKEKSAGEKNLYKQTKTHLYEVLRALFLRFSSSAIV